MSCHVGLSFEELIVASQCKYPNKQPAVSLPCIYIRLPLSNSVSLTHALASDLLTGIHLSSAPPLCDLLRFRGVAFLCKKSLRNS